MDTLKKRWDATLRCWVLDTSSDVRESGKYYDAATNTWLDMEGRGTVDLEKREEGFSSCEIPPKQLGPAKPEHYKTCTCRECKPVAIMHHGNFCSCYQCNEFRRGKGIPIVAYTHNTHHGSTSNYYQNQNWKPVRPYEGVQFEKWPGTYMFLVKFYFYDQDWYSGGKHISDTDYRDRILNKIYKPESKSVRSYSYPYTDDEWENGIG